MSWNKMQSGRTVGKMRQNKKSQGGSSPNACNRMSRVPADRFPLGKYRNWDASDPTGLREAAELKRKIVNDGEGLRLGRLTANYLARSR